MSRVPAAEAQTTLGGHVGFVLPLVTHAGGNTTNIADNFSIGFPLGVTFKGSGRMAYDRTGSRRARHTTADYVHRTSGFGVERGARLRRRNTGGV